MCTRIIAFGESSTEPRLQLNPGFNWTQPQLNPASTEPNLNWTRLQLNPASTEPRLQLNPTEPRSTQASTEPNWTQVYTKTKYQTCCLLLNLIPKSQFFTRLLLPYWGWAFFFKPIFSQKKVCVQICNFLHKPGFISDDMSVYQALFGIFYSLDRMMYSNWSLLQLCFHLTRDSYKKLKIYC